MEYVIFIFTGFIIITVTSHTKWWFKIQKIKFQQFLNEKWIIEYYETKKVYTYDVCFIQMKNKKKN